MSAVLFDKHPSGLDAVEAALAAALVRAPNAPTEAVVRRACEVLRAQELGSACAELPGLAAARLGRRAPTRYAPVERLAPHLARRLLGRAGEAVTSTLDARTQRLANAILRRHLAALAARNVEDGAVVVLDNDLDRRAPALLADDLLRRRPPTIALATLEDRLTAQADVVLPAATVAEATGTFVSHEGRAQRFFSVLPPAGEARPAWRWARDLIERLGRKEAHGWRTQDDVLADLVSESPALRAATTSAPPAGWRGDGRKVARRPQRYSGRTAVDAGRTVHEPAPAPDPDSPLAYSLEGLPPEESPAALRARVWSPGWNSVSGLHKFEQELEAVRPAASLGVRLLDDETRGRELPAVTAPPRVAATGNEFTLVAVHHIFGSEELSLYAPGIALRAPGAYIGLNREDADRLAVREGDWLEIWLPWMDTRARFAPLPSLAPGTAGIPVGLPGLPYISLPAHARLARAEGPA